MLRRHASIPLLLPPVSLKQDAYTPCTDAAEEPFVLLDRSGALFRLHSAGRAPLIPYLQANPPLAPFKRHSFALASKQSTSASAMPKEQIVVDFDVALRRPSSPLAHNKPWLTRRSGSH